VGMAEVGGKWHASLWSGTAASWVDLHPIGFEGGSIAYGTDGEQQVGEILISHVQQHASLWSGTAASWVDLNPAGCTSSGARAISGGKQVGAASGTVTGNEGHASLWSGTAASWVDLHKMLSSDFIFSCANSVEILGDEIWIGGWAYSQTEDNHEAVLWHYNPIPEPCTLALLALGGVAIARRRR
jgi:hypothetical protein